MARIASFHLARWASRDIPSLLARVPLDRMALRRTPGVVVAKHLGTGRGRSMSPAADLARWATFVTWEDEQALDAFLASSSFARRWDAAEERWHVRLRPLGGHGRWSGVELGAPDEASPGPVAVLTRARIRLRALRAFYAAVPAVDSDVLGRPDLLASVGIGEWPLALQGTFSLWSSTEAMRAFAYRDDAHRAVIRSTRRDDWYAEELFARYAPYASDGTWDGRDPLR